MTEILSSPSWSSAPSFITKPTCAHYFWCSYFTQNLASVNPDLKFFLVPLVLHALHFVAKMLTVYCLPIIANIPQIVQFRCLETKAWALVHPCNITTQMWRVGVISVFQVVLFDFSGFCELFGVQVQEENEVELIYYSTKTTDQLYLSEVSLCFYSFTIFNLMWQELFSHKH